MASLSPDGLGAVHAFELSGEARPGVVMVDRCGSPGLDVGPEGLDLRLVGRDPRRPKRWVIEQRAVKSRVEWAVIAARFLETVSRIGEPLVVEAHRGGTAWVEFSAPGRLFRDRGQHIPGRLGAETQGRPCRRMPWFGTPRRSGATFPSAPARPSSRVAYRRNRDEKLDGI